MPVLATDVTEIISYFIGQMRLLVEGDRLRQDPEDGDHPSAPPPELDLPASDPAAFSAGQVPIGTTGTVDYAIPDPQHAAFDAQTIPFTPLPIDVPLSTGPLADQMPDHIFFPVSDVISPFMGPTPTSVYAAVNQYILLSDEDVIVMGTPDFAVPEPYSGEAKLEELISDVDSAVHGANMLPLNALSAPLDAVAKTLVAQADAVIAPTAQGASLSGVWVNGTTGATEPVLDDHLPNGISLDPEDPEPTPSDPPSQILIEAEEEGTTMTVSSGGDLLVNEAQIVSAGAVAGIMAVAGDCHAFDVIVQVNALVDIDSIDPALEGVCDVESAGDMAVNLASFLTPATEEDSDEPLPNLEQMPTNWQVSIHEGDLSFLNWMQQYTCALDGDVLALTATGTSSTLGTGGNTAMNAAGIADLGLMYDLIIVGGSLYDINYITQTNILYDSDALALMDSLPGQTGTITGDDNLLWNEASILNVGGSNWTPGLPDHYAEAMDGLDSGKMIMPAGFATDSDFVGTSTLKVLYVTGNFYDINYIEQTNVLGDPDQVLLHANGVFDAEDVEWTVTTGGNALINAAAIVDQDAVGDVAYLGGELYSEAMLFQSEIIELDEETQTPPVSEIVAFLPDAETEGLDDFDEAPQYTPVHAPTPDMLETMLA